MKTGRLLFVLLIAVVTMFTVARPSSVFATSERELPFKGTVHGVNRINSTFPT